MEDPFVASRIFDRLPVSPCLLLHTPLHGRIWIHQSTSHSIIFIPSNPNTPLPLAASSPPMTPPAGPSSTAGSRQPMPSRTFPSSSPSSFPIFFLNLVILRSELCHELTSKSTNLALMFWDTASACCVFSQILVCGWWVSGYESLTLASLYLMLGCD